MKKLIYKDNKKRTTVHNFEKKKKILSSIFKNNSLSIFIRWNALNKLSNSPKNVNSVRLNQRCIITGRKTKTNKILRLIFFSNTIYGSLNVKDKHIPFQLWPLKFTS